MKGGSQLRTSLLALAGVYLVYLAWEMLNTMRKGETEMQPWLSIVFISFFSLAGIGIMIFAWRVWRKEKEKGPEEEKEETPDDETHLRKD